MCRVGGPGDPLEKPSAGRLAAEPLRLVPACGGTAGGRGPRAAEGAGAGPALSHSLRGLGQLTAAV